MSVKNALAEPICDYNREEYFFITLINDLAIASELGADKETLTSMVGMLERAFTDNDTTMAAWVAYGLAIQIAEVHGIDKAKQIQSEANRRAANTGHAMRQEILERSKTFVRLDLDSNCNPEWTTADYFNHLRKDPEKNKRGKKGYLLVSDDELKKAIRAIFKERGLADRIAKGAALHVKRQK